METDKTILPITLVASPFKMFINYSRKVLYNTAPTVDFLPERLSLIANQKRVINFGLPFDFEDNLVAVKSISSLSLEGNIVYDDWLTLRNSTIFSEVKLEIYVPEDAVSTEFNIVVVIGDDHKRSPLTTSYKIEVTVQAKAPEAGSDFDIFAYAEKNKQKKIKNPDLPPPIMTIDAMDDLGNIKIHFNQNITFVPS